MTVSYLKAWQSYQRTKANTTCPTLFTISHCRQIQQRAKITQVYLNITVDLHRIHEACSHTWRRWLVEVHWALHPNQPGIKEKKEIKHIALMNWFFGRARIIWHPVVRMCLMMQLVNLSFNFLRGSVASRRYHCGLRRRMFVFVMTGPG